MDDPAKGLLLDSTEKEPEVQKESAKISGRNICYFRAGSGRPLVWVHGLLGGAFCWRFNLPVFARRFTNYAVDLPGCGESEAPRDGEFGMVAQAEHLRGFLGELGLGQVDLVGSSWGGGIAQFFAAANPQLVRSLVLVSPVNPWSELGLGRVRFFGGRLGATLLRAGMPFSRPLHFWGLKRMYGDPQRIPEGTLEGYSLLFSRRGLAGNVVRILRAWERDLDALRTVPKNIQAPTLLIWGSRDTAVDPCSAEVLRQKLPHCELAIIEGAGHVPFEETPEEFNRIMLEFLGNIGSSGDRTIGPPGHHHRPI